MELMSFIAARVEGSMRKHLSSALTCLLAAALLPAGSATAQPVPEDLSRLVKERADRVERRLEQRGFVLAFSDRANGRSWQYWWSRREDHCLLLMLTGGRLRAIDPTSESDCVPRGGDPRRVSAPGRVAREAARRVGVEALMHRTHERGGRHADVDSVANFERGYRDAASGRPEDRRARPAAYSAGYRAASDGRADRPRPPVIDPGPPLGVRDPSELVGTREIHLERTMGALGFQNWGGFEKDRQTFATWRNAATLRCLKTTARDGVVTAVIEGGDTDCR